MIRLDRAKIEALIVEGDNCQGRYILAVAPDGSAHELLWEQHSRPWNDYPRGWLTTELPAVHPDSSGRASEDAEDIIRDVLGRAAWESARRRHADEEIGWVALAEELCPEDWAINISNQAQELAWQWICGLNGEANDLYMIAPWGEDDRLEPIECPHRFDWA